MKSYQLIHQLLLLAEEFEAENKREATLPEFAGFLVNHLQGSAPERPASDVRFGDSEQPAQDLAYQLDNNISRLVLYMSRYAKSYIKKALDGTPLQSPEDFTCLAILLTHEDLSKSELINSNIQEKTSGTEVIRRLIKAGLVKQWADEKDRRGKRISITEAGKKLLYTLFEHMTHVGSLITGKLTFDEKLSLQHMLQKLEDFHHQLHEDRSVSTKEDLATCAKSLV